MRLFVTEAGNYGPKWRIVNGYLYIFFNAEYNFSDVTSAVTTTAESRGKFTRCGSPLM